MGLNCMEGIVINEELSWGCTGISTAIEACSLAEAPLLVAANDEQKKEYLGRMTAEPIQAGPRCPCCAWSPPQLTVPCCRGCDQRTL